MPKGREFWRFGAKMSSQLIDHHIAHNGVEVTNGAAERVFRDLFVITMDAGVVFVTGD